MSGTTTIYPTSLGNANSLVVNPSLLRVNLTNPLYDPSQGTSSSDAKESSKSDSVMQDSVGASKEVDDNVAPLPVMVEYEGEAVNLPFLSGTSLDDSDKLYCTFKRHSIGVHPAERKLPYCYPIVVYSCREHGKHVDERLRAAYNSNRVNKKKKIDNVVFEKMNFCLFVVSLVKDLGRKMLCVVYVWV